MTGHSREAVNADIAFLISNLPLLRKAWAEARSDKATAELLGVSLKTYKWHLLSFPDRHLDKIETVAAARLLRAKRANARRQAEWRSRVRGEEIASTLNYNAENDATVARRRQRALEANARYQAAWRLRQGNKACAAILESWDTFGETAGDDWLPKAPDRMAVARAARSRR